MTTQTLIHLPVESYQSRYTANLADWERIEFSRHFSYLPIVPKLDQQTAVINSGEVLDSIQRPLWTAAQISSLLRTGGKGAKVYCSDFYTPGLDALAYSRLGMQLFSFCWAQTFDQYDFTRRLFFNWMRPWEIMALELYDRVFVACSGLKELIETVLPHVAHKIVVTGLPYNSRNMFSLLRSMPAEKSYDVVYAGRWDEEKNPDLFLDLVAEYKFNAVVCSGQPTLGGSAVEAINRAKEMAAVGQLRILTGLTRQDYCHVLSASHYIFNAADQDWVSYTLLDALTFGCRPMYPAHRSFPGALLYDDSSLYRPGFIAEAGEKIAEGILQPSSGFGPLSQRILEYHDSALTRIANEILHS